MLLAQIVDSLQRNVSGGKTDMSNRFDKGYVKKMIHNFRAKKIEADFMKTGYLNPQVYQKFYLKYDPNIQANAFGGNFVLFNLPNVIQLGEEDGIRYIGSISCSDAWIRLRSRGMMANFNNNKFTKISNRKESIFALYDGAHSTLEVYNNMSITEGVVEGVFANPQDVPTWNEDKDPYPLNADAIAELETMIYYDRTEIGKATPVPQTFNMPDNTAIQPPKNVRPTQQ